MGLLLTAPLFVKPAGRRKDVSSGENRHKPSPQWLCNMWNPPHTRLYFQGYPKLSDLKKIPSRGQFLLEQHCAVSRCPVFQRRLIHSITHINQWPAKNTPPTPETCRCLCNPWVKGGTVKGRTVAVFLYV